MSKFKLSLIILTVGLSGCGGGSGGSGGSADGSTQTVQLNAQQTYTIPSQSFTLVGTKVVTMPSEVLVVSGTFSGLPGQYLHARITVGGDSCEYLATNPSDTSLLVQSCTMASTPYASGSVVELQAYDAPGLLLEAYVTLSN